MREFNRFYTNVLGLLREGLVESPYSLTEARVIFELAQRQSTEVADLRQTLNLDAGYLSRVLARLEADGLVRRAPSPADARRHTVALTRRGRAQFAQLDRGSAKQVAELLDGHPEPEQRRLVGAMRAIQDVLDEEPASDSFVLRPPAPGDLGWIVERHGAVYTHEFGWDDRFEALVARIVADYANEHDPASDAAWIAEVDGERAGCVLCVREDEDTAKLRLLLVDPRARGLGIGRRLVDECLRFARRAGYNRMILWTNDVLTSARPIYQAAGFELVGEEPHTMFGPKVVGQTWSREL